MSAPDTHALMEAELGCLQYSLKTAREHEAQARAAAERRTAERDQAYLERDAAARELAAVLAERDAPPTASPGGLDLARRAVKLWGAKAQMGQAIEECAELILAIRHYDRGRVGYAEVADEVIDVEFMCRQLRAIIGSHFMGAAESRKMAKVIRKVTEAEAKRGEVT